MRTHRQKKCAAEVWLKCMQRHDNESSDLWRRQRQLFAQLLRQNKSKHSERTVPLRANCNNDQHYRDEQQPFDTTTRKRTTEEEKARMITHGSNKTTGLYNSHDDHDTASVSQHIKDARSPFYTPERRTRAVSKVQPHLHAVLAG